MIYLFISIISVLGIVLYDYNWNNITSNDRNDLIFEGKNKKYGAYEIRKNYSRKTFFSLLGVMVGFTAAISSPKMFTWENNSKEEKRPSGPLVIIDEIKNPPPEIEIPEVTPPETPVEPPSLPVEVLAVLPPIASDEIPEPPNTVNDLQNNNIGTQNVNGNDSLVGYAVTTPPPPPPPPPGDPIYEIPDIMPEFDGLKQYLKEHTHYPADARNIDMQGTVYVAFIVDAHGKAKVTGFKRKVFDSLDEEAKRVINTMPLWSPGMHNGKPVPVRMVLPFRFEIKN